MQKLLEIHGLQAMVYVNFYTMTVHAFAPSCNRVRNIPVNTDFVFFSAKKMSPSYKVH